jgi:hypothetical protein
VTKRYVWHLGDHVITFALADDHVPQAGDVAISPESPGATADRLEPQLAREFLKAVSRMKDLLPDAALTAALESGDPARVAAVLSQAQLYDALLDMPGVIHDAAVRGATGASPEDGDPPDEVVSEVDDELDREAETWVDDMAKEIR